MTKKELDKRLRSFGNCDFDKTLFQEYISFCNNSTQYEFDLYFKQKEIDDMDFFTLLDVMYENDCYNMLYRLLRDNRERLVIKNLNSLKNMKINKNLDERMERLIM